MQGEHSSPLALSPTTSQLLWLMGLPLLLLGPKIIYLASLSLQSLSPKPLNPRTSKPYTLKPRILVFTIRTVPDKTILNPLPTATHKIRKKTKSFKLEALYPI